jgi:hypothetical protein
MPRYRIYRLKDWRREHFQNAPPASGAIELKKKDYEPGDEIEAATPYAAWQQSRSAGRPIEVGDALESDTGALVVCKYVGFEEARWFVPPAPEAAGAPAEPAPATPSSPQPGQSDAAL